MIDLVFKDSNDNVFHFSKDVYDLTFSNEARGGPTSLQVTVPIDLIEPKVKAGMKVFLYDELELLWQGRVEQRPKVTVDNRAAIVECIGYMSVLKDGSFMEIYQDSLISNWEETDSVNTPLFSSSEMMNTQYRLDKANRLSIRLQPGSYSVNASHGFIYRIPKGSGLTLKKVTANYATNFRGSVFQGEAATYTTTGAGFAEIWDSTGVGASSGTVSSTFGTNVQFLNLRMRNVSGSTVVSPTTLDGEKAGQWHTTWTIPKIYGTTLLTTPIKASDIIKDILSKSTNSLSTDTSLVTDTTPDTEQAAFREPITYYDAFLEIDEGYEYNYGFNDSDTGDRPRFTWSPHKSSEVDYFVTTRNAFPDIAGDSLEGVVNKVFVNFKNGNDTKRSITRTKTVAELDALSLTRSETIDVNTQSSNQAARHGDAHLELRARPQTKGSLLVTGGVRDKTGTFIPNHQIKPGKNIMIRDLEAAPADLTTLASTNVLNGKNIFRITQTDVIYPQSASLQLDSGANTLEDILRNVSQ